MKFAAAVLGSIAVFASAQDCSLDCMNECFWQGPNDCFVTECGCSEYVADQMSQMFEKAVQKEHEHFEETMAAYETAYNHTVGVLNDWSDMTEEERAEAKAEFMRPVEEWRDE